MSRKTLNRLGQVTVYVIIAIVIVGAIASYFFFRQYFVSTPKESYYDFNQVFDYYRGCIFEETKLALRIAGAQGGYIEVPNYVPGNEYSPFSSQLNFLGFPVPYWFYVSQSGLIKEQVPTRQHIEGQIARFIEEGLANCNVEQFREKGYNYTLDEPSVRVVISDDKVTVDVSAEMVVYLHNVSQRVVNHHVEVPSKFGKFYRIARDIYEKQKKEAFFENFAIDTIYSYAPVDGVEISCTPKIWGTRQVVSDLKRALEQNFAAIKFKGDYYELRKDINKYFVVNLSVDEPVNVMYSSSWPTKIEVFGNNVDDELMRADPVGNQEGLGAMGFCYVPYHFVYDLSFPVLIQIYTAQEVFQFPVVVIVDNNVPRKSNLTKNPFDSSSEDYNLCEFQSQDILVNLFNKNLRPIDGNISYSCFNQICRLGETSNGVLYAKVPSCVNGYLIVKADGYADKKQLFSSNREYSADIILEREYKVILNLSVGNELLQKVGGMAFVSFVRDDGKTASAALPHSNEVKLSEGSYEVKVYVYSNSSVTIPGGSRYQCVRVPKGGLSGLFGGTKEECFSVDIPATKLDYVLIGGGTSKIYLTESELSKRNARIVVSRFPTPSSIEDMQKNFDNFEMRRVDIFFYERRS